MINGSSLRPDKEDDYHGWYNEEHGPVLSLVPGWNEKQRYRLEKSYGEVGKFYGFNYYDEKNGHQGQSGKQVPARSGRSVCGAPMRSPTSDECGRLNIAS